MDEGKSYWVIKKAYDTLNDAFDHAVKNGDLPLNPMATVGAPTKANFDHEDTRALTVAEEQALLQELERTYVSSGKYVYQYRDAYRLLLNTGLRLGELVALDWVDVDFDAKTLSVSKNAIMIRVRDKEGNSTGNQKQIIQPTPKTKSSNRIIPLNSKAMDALKCLKTLAGDSPYVVNTGNHTRPLCGALLKSLQGAYKKCGIYNAGVHTLRHTFATRLFERGAQVKDVSTILGHSSVAITANTYIPVIGERKREIVALLEDEDQ
jgi:integrase